MFELSEDLKHHTQLLGLDVPIIRVGNLDTESHGTLREQSP